MQCCHLQMQCGHFLERCCKLRVLPAVSGRSLCRPSAGVHGCNAAVYRCSASSCGCNTTVYRCNTSIYGRSTAIYGCSADTSGGGQCWQNKLNSFVERARNALMDKEVRAPRSYAHAVHTRGLAPMHTRGRAPVRTPSGTDVCMTVCTWHTRSDTDLCTVWYCPMHPLRAVWY